MYRHQYRRRKRGSRFFRYLFIGTIYLASAVLGCYLGAKVLQIVSPEVYADLPDFSPILDRLKP